MRYSLFFIINILYPPYLQEYRKRQQFTRFYKIVAGHVTAMPPEDLLMPADRNGRRIRPTTYKGCDSNNNTAILTTILTTILRF